MLNSLQFVSQNANNNIDVFVARVISVNPLSIQSLSNQKLIIPAEAILVGERLSKRKEKVRIDNSSITSSSSTIEYDVGLKNGDAVLVLAFDDKQTFYILDKVVKGIGINTGAVK